MTHLCTSAPGQMDLKAHIVKQLGSLFGWFCSSQHLGVLKTSQVGLWIFRYFNGLVSGKKLINQMIQRKTACIFYIKKMFGTSHNEEG